MNRNIALTYSLVTEMEVPIEGTIIICNCPKNIKVGIQTAVITTACWFTTSISVGSDNYTYLGENFYIELKSCIALTEEETQAIKKVANVVRSTIEIVEYDKESAEIYSADLDYETRKALHRSILDFSNNICQLEKEKD